MTTVTKPSAPQRVLELAQALHPKDVEWLIEQLQEFIEEPPLPESATIDEAIELYLDDQCSLSKAAELAGTNRWVLQDIMRERGILATYDSGVTDYEFDNMINFLQVNFDNN